MGIKAVELLVVDEFTKKSGGSNRLRVVDWQTDDGKSYKLLEKREFYVTDEGEERTGKAKGFNAKDMGKIKSNWDKIISAMQGPGQSSTEEAPPEESLQQEAF